MEYIVTFSRDGYIVVEAENQEQAITFAEEQLKETGSLDSQGDWYQIEVLQTKEE